jgi:hypothetical protein
MSPFRSALAVYKRIATARYFEPAELLRSPLIHGKPLHVKSMYMLWLAYRYKIDRAMTLH